ncbi:hypothetical protein DFP72DRAFT_369734 [Ephemerocybe angulata]|uniref:Uncharacterized protein n=1 Tax=Ephemerocybe angulata TaxID=980116 RepID=A0A8H6M7S6_9AGAR|nr:hypothetical protein DFP72DRAFT_369734 [Tulosesus angulatus]
MPTTRSQRKPAKEAVPKPYKKADALPDVSKMRNTRSQAKAAKEAVPEKPKPLNKTDAKVPHPGVSNLNGPAGPSHAHRSRKTQLVLADDKERHRALQWFRRAPVFRIRGVHLADFLERGKNTKEGKRLAEEQAGRMADWAADAGSMIVCDEDGEVLACAFAWCFGGEVLREKGDKIDFKNAPFYPGPEGRTLADVVEKDILSADGKKVLKRKTYYDGFTESQIRDYHVVLQEVSALVDPVANARDMRHPDDAFMSYPAEREGVYPNGFTHERTGVKHYVHGWPMQGHPNGILYPSADLARGCLANLTAQHYFDVTAPAVQRSSRAIQGLFSRIFREIRRRFQSWPVCYV